MRYPRVADRPPCHTPSVNDYADRLLAKLAPEGVTQTMIRAGCFLSAYELLKSQIIDAVHDFYWHGEMKNGQKVTTLSATRKKFWRVIPRANTGRPATG